MVAGALGLQVTSADISRLSMESDDSSSDSGTDCALEGDNSSSDNGTDCALEENWHESNEVVEEGKNDNTASENDVHWVWHATKMSHRSQKHPLNELCGLQKNVECVLEASLLFSNQHLFVLLLKPTGIQVVALKFLC